MEPFYEGENHSFYAVSAQAETAISGLADREWAYFLVATEVFERSRTSGRPYGAIVVSAGEDLFVLDTTRFGGHHRFVCARLGSRVLVAHVLGRRRDVGQREIGEARDAIRKWKRRKRSFDQ